ncbi:triose-phosphate isomerase [bacterium SCSIO 12741]|nr:triose-phosphate isomerase [bacterium SCSIO 12741]
MARKVLFGNWKMNNNLAEAGALLANLKEHYQEPTEDLLIGVSPSFPFIALAVEELKGSPFQVSAQNISSENSGAFTGEVSADMIASLGAGYTLVGHSERRALFGEENAILRKKTDLALAAGIQVIYCIGETLEERRTGKLESVIREQIEQVVFGRDAAELENMILAYEPVWAIGTGETASPEQAQEVHAFIRRLITEEFGADVANNLSLIYGGSCKPANAQELFACPDIDGGLIGGASLKAEDFVAIARSF